MEFINNDPRHVEIRKRQNTLIVVGSGTILFSIWTTVKILGMFFMFREENTADFLEMLDDTGDVPDIFFFWVLAAVLILGITICLCVTIYVGRSAIAEGRGKKKGVVYLLFACVMIASSAYSIYYGLFNAGTTEQLGSLTGDQSFAALITELISLIMMIEMVYSAFRIRKLRKAPKHEKV